MMNHYWCLVKKWNLRRLNVPIASATHFITKAALLYYFSATTIRPIIHTLLPFQRISTLAMKLLPQKRLIWRMY